MKKYTLYSLFFMKNVIRLFFISLMIEYLFILFWWNTNPQHHTVTLWMPLGFTAMYSSLLILIYIFRLKHEKIKIDEANLYYYKQRFLLSHVTFYPIEKQNNKIRILIFHTEQKRTFIFSIFLQKKRYQKICQQLQLTEIEYEETMLSHE